MLEIFMGPWWSTYLHQPVLLSCRCRGWLMAGRMRGRACDGSFLRRLHCCDIQISRFHGNKRIRKLLHQVDLGDGRVQIPYRERPGAAESTCNYKVVALSVHLGNTPSSGHYRAVLIAEGSPLGVPRTGDDCNAVAGVLYTGALYTDDGSSATPVLDGDVHAIMCNMYLLWCIKVE